MEPKFFADQEQFREWLNENSDTASELLVGFYKVGSGKPSMTWPESVDQALCFGWIDGVRRRIDEDSYSIRFSPRRSTSIWSAINIDKAERLIANGMMMTKGLEAFERRSDDRSRIYEYENTPKSLSEDMEDRFRSNKEAWEFLTSQAPSYQRLIVHYVMSAKQEKTRLSRLEKAINASASGKRL